MEKQVQSGQAHNPEKKYSVKFKRSRSSRACEVCHSRKVRCDATIHIPCTNCLTFGCECRFPEPKQRKNAKKRNDDGVVLNGDSANSTSSNKPTIATTSTTTTSSSRRKHEPLAAISARSAQIDSQKLLRKHINLVSFVGPSSAAALITSSDSMTKTNSHYSIDDWVPASLKLSINKTRSNLDTVQLEILRLRGAFHLPEKELCDELVEAYFQHVYPIEPIMDKKTFMEDYNNEKVSLLLLQSVLLAASRVSSSELILDADGSNYLASCTFYQRAKALFDANYEDDPIAVIQSLILFSRFWEGIDEILGNSFYWIRVAISAAQGYGFHRDMSKSNLSPHQVRVAKLLWWNLYVKDVSSSVAYGRPRMIQLEDCDVPMITIDELPDDLTRQDAEVFIQLIRLTEIVSIIIQEQYSVRAEKARQRDNLAINHCDMIMSSWRNNLSSSLQYSPHQNTILSASILNLYYYSTVILVHRSNMVKLTHLNGKQYPSEGIVFRASRIIADIVQKIIKRNQIKYCHAVIISVLFNASLTFVCHMDSKNSGIAKSAKEGYAVCAKALTEVGANYLMATFIYHSMERFAKDKSLREKLVTSLARKNDDLQTPAPNGNGISGQTDDQNTTPVGYVTPVIPRPLTKSTTQQSQVPSKPTQPQSQSLAPSTIQLESPFNNSGTQGSPMVQQDNFGHASSHGSRVHQQTIPHLPIPQPQQPQPVSQQPITGHPSQVHQFKNSESIEFPDLYLFTNNLPSSTSNINFDPSQLFPSRELNTGPNSTSDENTSDTAFNANDINMNLPEFDFQSFSNSISIQNLASLSTYLDQSGTVQTTGDVQPVTLENQTQEDVGQAQGQRLNSANSSNIYSFVN